MVCFWRKILASVLMVFVVSNESCSAGSEASEELSKSSLAIDIGSNIGWIYNAGRPYDQRCYFPQCAWERTNDKK